MAYVQRVAVNDDFGGDATLVLNITPSAGSLLALGFAWEVASGFAISSVADNQGNTWTAAAAAAATGVIDKVAGYYAMNVAGAATTITVTLTGAPDRFRGRVHEYSGRALTGALDIAKAQGQTNPGTGTDAVTTGTASVTADGCDIMGFSSESNDQPVYTAGTNYTLGGTLTGTADERRENVSAGSHAATFTINSGAADPTTLMMAFAPPAAGGQPTSKRFGGVPSMSFPGRNNVW